MNLEDEDDIIKNMSNLILKQSTINQTNPLLSNIAFNHEASTNMTNIGILRSSFKNKD